MIGLSRNPARFGAAFDGLPINGAQQVVCYLLDALVRSVRPGVVAPDRHVPRQGAQAEGPEDGRGVESRSSAVDRRVDRRLVGDGFRPAVRDNPLRHDLQAGIGGSSPWNSQPAGRESGHPSSCPCRRKSSAPAWRTQSPPPLTGRMFRAQRGGPRPARRIHGRLDKLEHAPSGPIVSPWYGAREMIRLCRPSNPSRNGDAAHGVARQKQDADAALRDLPHALVLRRTSQYSSCPTLMNALHLAHGPV